MGETTSEQAATNEPRASKPRNVNCLLALRQSTSASLARSARCFVGKQARAVRRARARAGKAQYSTVRRSERRNRTSIVQSVLLFATISSDDGATERRCANDADDVAIK